MATIVGLILHPTGEPRTVPLNFQPLSTPQAKGGSLITSTEPKAVTSHQDGSFSIDLEQGDYRVKIGSDQVQICVPNDNQTYQFTQLLCQDLTFVPGDPPETQFPAATADVMGGVRTNTTSPDPVVYLKEEVDLLITTLPDRYYVHFQNTPSTQWDAFHGLGRSILPAIWINGEIAGGDIKEMNLNHTRINFRKALTGKAVFTA